MPPITIRALGATVPLRPSAESGIYQGNATALAAIAPRVRNRRRVSGVLLSVLIDSPMVTIEPPQLATAFTSSRPQARAASGSGADRETSRLAAHTNKGALGIPECSGAVGAAANRDGSRSADLDAALASSKRQASLAKCQAVAVFAFLAERLVFLAGLV